METRPLGHSDMHVSAVCLGTMTFGQQNSEEEAHRQLDFAVQQGINFIDTAEMYPVPPKADTCHRTESIVGTWLARQARDKIILATKVTGPRRAMNWIRGGPASLDETNIRSALEGSLRRLGTDYVDLYQIHWPERNVPMFGQYLFDPDKETDAVPIRDQLETLSALVKEGKIRHIGLSNEHPWGVMEFLRLAREHGLERVVSIQNAYSLLNRSAEICLAEILHRENLAFLAYSPLAFGHLTGKYLRDHEAPGRVTLFKGFAQRYDKPNVPPAVAAYAGLAKELGITPTRLALAFVYHRWFVTSTIIGATSLEQLQENLAAWHTPLDADIQNRVEAIHLRYFNPAP
ncbi:MAG: aldo/keto reductase [Pseudomonadota bacterium]